MSAPLPDALRAWFQRYIEEGLSGRAAALRFKLSPATGARWTLAIRRTGRAEAAPQGRPNLATPLFINQNINDADPAGKSSVLVIGFVLKISFDHKRPVTEAHLRRIGARTVTDLFEALEDICEMSTP